MDYRFERLKQALFCSGTEALEDFLGYGIPEGEDEDVTDNRLDIAYLEMSDEDLERFYARYAITA